MADMTYIALSVKKSTHSKLFGFRSELIFALSVVATRKFGELQ
jgi:hypothetical protein